MIIAVILPDLALRAALDKARNRLREAIALAPQHDGIQVIGEVSETAGRLGLRPGMGLGEAIDICPTLTLIPPDPIRAAAVWEDFMLGLEGLGAGVESRTDGEAFFAADGLERLYGNLSGLLEKVRNELGPGVRIGTAACRLAAYAAARLQKTAEDEVRVVDPGEVTRFLSTLPVAILIDRVDATDGGRAMVNSFIRLGLNRLADLAALPSHAVADRFGKAGIQARELALGLEDGIRPRTVREEICRSLELPEADSGLHLAGGLNILCGRVASQLNTEGRRARRLCLEADLVGGGSWVHESSPRRPTASQEIFRMILTPGLEQLPRPAGRLRLRVGALAAGDPEQIEIIHQPGQIRHRRLSEAVNQVRAVAGNGGLMRVLDAEPDSYLPERRMLLTPYLAGGDKAGGDRG